MFFPCSVQLLKSVYVDVMADKDVLEVLGESHQLTSELHVQCT